MSIYSKFIDKTARKPGGSMGRFIYRESRSHRRGFELIKARLDIQNSDHFLEIGCGGGVLLSELLETAHSATAIDHSEDMLTLTRARNAKAISEQRLEVVQGSVYQLPWEDNQFDVVVSSHMFFFLEHPSQALKEVYRVLKPGGKVIVLTVRPSIWLNLMLLPYIRSMYVHSDQQMQTYLHAAGFAPANVEAVTYFDQLSIAYKPKDGPS